MKEHIVIVDEGKHDDLNQLQNIDKTRESIEILADSFIAVAEKMKTLADALRDELVDIHDPASNKRKKEKTFKENVSNLKHVKKRGKW